MDTTIADRSTDADLIARVVAWHNRSPLTCRINPAQVTGIGIVALPCAFAGTAADDHASAATTPSGSRFAQLAARGRSLATAWARRLRFGGTSSTQTLFDEDFIPPLKPRRVARFANDDGELVRPEIPGWPTRDIPLAVAAAGAPHSTRYLRTAAIEYGGRRLRVLIGGGARPAVIGPRVWSRKRLSGLLAGIGASAFATLLVLFWPSPAPPAAGPQLAHSGSNRNPPAAAATAAPSVEASASTAPGQAAVAATSASTPAVADEVKLIAADRPVPVPPTQDIGEAVDQAGHDRQLVAAGLARVPAEIPPTPAAAEVFALAAEPTRSRIGSMLRMTLLDVPTEPRKDGAHAEVMQTGAQWRVVIWPYPSRQAAELARDSLRERGVKIELISF